jgi:hypothetical protein
MSTVTRCPECKLPLTIDESSAGLCALCGASLPATSPLSENLPAEPKPPAPPSFARQALLASVALVLFIVAGVLISDWAGLFDDNEPQSFSENGTELQEPPKPKNDKPPSLAKKESKEKKQASSQGKEPETLEPKASAFVGPPEPKKQSPPVIVAAKTAEFVGPPVPEKKALIPRVAKPIVVSKDTRLDDPDGEVMVTSLIGKTMKLTGKVHRLTINDVSGRSILDASGLQAKEIIVLRPLLNNSTVRLNAPGGTVEFRGMISGRTQLFVHAPNGSVAFKANGGTIINESKLTITARSVEFNDRIQGWNNHIVVTLNAGGRLKFKEVGGGSKLYYKKAHPNDPEPDILAGEVINQGELRKIN